MLASLIGLIIFILDIYAIVKILGNGALSVGMKVLWIILVLIFPLIGMLLYFLLADKKAAV